MHPSSEPDIVARLKELAPFQSEAEARKALAATLAALSDLLFEDELELLTSELPPELAKLMTPRRTPRKATAQALATGVTRREHIRRGLGVEHAQVACRALAEALQPATREALSRKLPELAPLLEVPEPPEAPLSEPHRATGAPHDLAEGRAGGTHPVASSTTSTLTHRHSVARSADPHADTRLSSARGLSQEREETTLASGRPGSRNPVSRSH